MIDKFNQPFLYFICLVIFIFFACVIFYFNSQENFEVEFIFLEERKLGDETENSLYKIFDGEKYYFLATNKILSDTNFAGSPAKRATPQNSKVEYLGSDIFWNPERCAQMKSFYTKEKIYFFDTTVANPEENEGEDFMNLLYIFDISNNILQTYKSSKYLNLAEIDKLNLNLESLDAEVKMFFRNQDNEIYQGTFDLENLKIYFECEDSKCFKNQQKAWQEKDLYNLGYQKTNNVYSKRPYIFQLRNRQDNQIILNLEEHENIYHFLVGY